MAKTSKAAPKKAAPKGKRPPLNLDIKEGTFRSALGVKEGEKVNPSDTQKIISAKEGAKVKVSTGKTVTATPLLKKKANLAKNMRSWKKG